MQCRQGTRAVRGPDRYQKSGHTVDGALELLSTNPAIKLPDTGFPIELDGNRLLVIAEEACECGWQRVGLVMNALALRRLQSRWLKRATCLFGPHGLPRRLLALPHAAKRTRRGCRGLFVRQP